MDISRLPTIFLPTPTTARERNSGSGVEAVSELRPAKQSEQNLPAEPILQGEVVSGENGATTTADDSAERLRFRFGVGDLGNDSARPLNSHIRIALNEYQQNEEQPELEQEMNISELDIFI